MNENGDLLTHFSASNGMSLVVQFSNIKTFTNILGFHLMVFTRIKLITFL